MEWEKFSESVKQLNAALKRLPDPEHFCTAAGESTPGAIDVCPQPTCKWISSTLLASADAAETVCDDV